MSIRRRLTFSLILALLILLGGSGVALYGCIRVELSATFDESLLSKAHSLQSVLRMKRGKIDFDFVDDQMPEFSPSPTAQYFQLWSSQGQSLERSESLESADILRPGLMSKEPKFVNMPLPDGRPGRVVLIRATANKKESDDKELLQDPRRSAAASMDPECVIEVARDRSSLDRTLATIGWALGGGSIALAFGIGALVPALVSRNLRSLKDIAKQASQIDPNSLDKRFSTENLPEELLPICTRLNDSLNKLQSAFDRERRFSADVAHELRTPISELKVLAEVALKYPQDPPASRRSFQDSLDIARQMEAIVATLLEMMANDATVPAGDLHPVNLANAVDETWNVLQSQAAARKIMLHNTLDRPFNVATHDIIVRRILHNVLGNTVEYSNPGSTVECVGELRNDVANVRICNSTSDLDDADLPHLAEPFWRKDSSRTGSEHSGLGLSLVSCYAHRLRIKLSWALPKPGLFELTLEFPLCPDSEATAEMQPEVSRTAS